MVLVATASGASKVCQGYGFGFEAGAAYVGFTYAGLSPVVLKYQTDLKVLSRASS